MKRSKENLLVDIRAKGGHERFLDKRIQLRTDNSSPTISTLVILNIKKMYRYQ